MSSGFTPQEPDFAENELIYEDLDLEEVQTGIGSCRDWLRAPACHGGGDQLYPYIPLLVTRSTITQDTHNHEVNVTGEDGVCR